jgi:hypothetical protein
MEFHGIPLHPLVVHAAVVFTPLAAVSSLGFALVERWRGYLRRPTLVLVVTAAAVDYTAKLTGQSLFNQLTKQGFHNKWLTLHQQRANTLVWIVLALAVVGVPATLAVPAGASAARLNTQPAVVLALRIAVVGLAVAALVYVYLTGDAGARSLWAPS